MVSIVVHMAHIDIAERTAQAVSQAALTKGRSIRSLADEAGIPTTTMGRKLKGVGEFTPSELYRLSLSLNTTVGDLIPTDVLTGKVA